MKIYQMVLANTVNGSDLAWEPFLWKTAGDIS